MKRREDIDEAILRVLHEAGEGLRNVEIMKGLPNPKPDKKQFNRSLRRLWKKCEVSRVDKPNQWGHHSFYIPSSMFGRREETRLADGLFGVVMCYLEDLCQIMPFEEAWQILLNNARNWLQSLKDPALKNAYRDFFSRAE